MPARAIRGTIDIACDESGFVGGSLFGDARVFAHASVSIGVDEAVDLLDEVRRRTGTGPGEVKASRLRRPSTRSVAAWLCGPEGRLHGRAVVHVTDTRLFGLARLAQVLAIEPAPEGWWSADQDPVAWELARRLDRVAADLPRAQERRFLLGARDLLWLTRQKRPRAPVESWVDVVGATAARLENDDDRRLVAGLASAAASQRVLRYLAAPPAAPLTEPILPALRWAVHHWSALGEPNVVHDEQSVLTPARVAVLAADLAATHPGRRISGFVRVDSREDPRVQVADLVVGVVRRTVEAQLSGPPGVANMQIQHLVASSSPLTPALRLQLASPPQHLAVPITRPSNAPA